MRVRLFRAFSKAFEPKASRFGARLSRFANASRLLEGTSQSPSAKRKDFGAPTRRSSACREGCHSNSSSSKLHEIDSQCLGRARQARRARRAASQAELLEEQLGEEEDPPGRQGERQHEQHGLAGRPWCGALLQAHVPHLRRRRRGEGRGAQAKYNGRARKDMMRPLARSPTSTLSAATCGGLGETG